jgi:hypothetical protein
VALAEIEQAFYSASWLGSGRAGPPSTTTNPRSFDCNASAVGRRRGRIDGCDAAVEWCLKNAIRNSGWGTKGTAGQ